MHALRSPATLECAECRLAVGRQMASQHTILNTQLYKLSSTEMLLKHTEMKLEIASHLSPSWIVFDPLFTPRCTCTATALYKALRRHRLLLSLPVNAPMHHHAPASAIPHGPPQNTPQELPASLAPTPRNCQHRKVRRIVISN